VWLTITIGTASATFAAGDIYGIVGGQAHRSEVIRGRAARGD
jgi:hypothetical protein